ncbi:MAG: membrane trafficking protein [Bacillota bacterium]|nr:membrane trafficking protein [Bacillota bacterium]
MANGFNKKLSDLLGKVDDKVLETKINAAIDMLKDGDSDEIAKKIGKIDKNDLMSKLNEIDENKLKEMNLSKAEMQQKLNSIDLDAFQKMLGEQGPQIISKIKDIIK